MLAVAASFAIFVAFSLYDMKVLGLAPHQEAPPAFDGYHLLRLLSAAGLSLWIVLAIPRGPASAPTGGNAARDGALALLSSLVLWAMVALFLISPQQFSLLAQEDHLVEWLSFAFCIGASLLFAAGALRLRKAGPGLGLARLVAAALALVLFVIAMEEVSWMQRVIGLETPEEFSANFQNELNLHNFSTNEVENLYYLGSFALLGFFPFLAAGLPVARDARVRALIPRRPVALSFLAMTACCWEMWNIIPIQMIFWISIFLLGVEVARQAQGPRWTLLLLVSMVAAQGIFLIYGGQLVRSWDLTEYRELFISFGFLVYSIGLLSTARAAVAPGG